MEEFKINIPGYKIVKKVGKGGMATLYKAIQLSLDRIVAIKQLHSFLVEDESFIERFQREARTLSKLEHPNIVRIYEFIKEKETSFIIMEFVEGVDLKFVIKKLGDKIPEQIALMFIYYILKGLAFAHHQDIIHRDIKPANILISKDGYVKIVDFGLARSEEASNLTMTGTLMGTPAYMSPEQAKGEPVNNQTDIFAAGIILYELLMGKKPYPNEKNYMSIIAKIISNEPLPAPELKPPISQKVINIYKKMVEKDIEKRYKDADDILNDIEDYFSDYNIKPDESIIKNYLKSPANFWANFKKEQIKKEFAQGEKLYKAGKSSYSDALVHFRRVLTWDPENEKAKNFIEKIEKNLKKGVPIFIPIAFVLILIAVLYFTIFNVKTQVNIDTNPRKAQIIFDGKLLKYYTPINLNVKPGTHTYTIKKEYYYDKTGKIFIEKGEKKSYSFDLDPWDYAMYKFVVKPADASIYLNKDKITNNEEKKLPFGEYQLLIEKRGYYSIKKHIKIDKPEKKVLKFTLNRSEKKFYINSEPVGATVYLDNTLLGNTPIETTIPFGEHNLKIILKDYETRTEKVNFQLNTPSKLHYTLKKKVLKYRKCYFAISGGFGMVYIDGRKIGYSPIKPQMLSVGTHKIKIEGKSIETYENNIIVKDIEGNRFKIKLKKNWGYLVVNSIPWAYVYLDGQNIGATPLAKKKVKTGKHILELKNKKCNTYKKTIIIKSGVTKSISAKLTYK